MFALSSASIRRSTLALVVALGLFAAVLLAVGAPAHAAPAKAPACPPKTYFLHKLQSRNKATKKINRKQCAGQWAGVIASSSYTYNSLFQHTSGNKWAYRTRNAKNCAAAPKKLRYICRAS